MNILYIAYSCAPNKGSEEKIGWNIPLESAKTNHVYVVTKEEQRRAITGYLDQHPVDHISFFFVDIPPFYKLLFPKGFLYSGRLNIWHRRAVKLAEQICQRENIDVIHQITPVEYRSIGGYGKIQGTKFLCGPLGGGECIPGGLAFYSGSNQKIELLRTAVNAWSWYGLKFSGKLKKCSGLLFANYETRDRLGKLIPKQMRTDVVTEIASDEPDGLCRNTKETNGVCSFLVAGRLVYRKGHAFLLDALKRIPGELDYTCRIVGDGPELEKLKRQCMEAGLVDRVIFTGRLQYTEMAKEYEQADVLIMPSIRETTGSVLLEAMSKGLPVVTINRFGGAVLLDQDTGWLYDGNTREEYLESLKDALVCCITQPEEVRRKGKNAAIVARQYTWENKLTYYNSIYKGLCNQTETGK